MKQLKKFVPEAVGKQFPKKKNKMPIWKEGPSAAAAEGPSSVSGQIQISILESKNKRSKIFGAGKSTKICFLT
jgi:hypothetical protein